MKIPKIIEFKSNCNKALLADLQCVRPNEGCALLLGNTKTHQTNHFEEIWQIKTIWPCCNTWTPNNINLIEPNKKLHSINKISLSRKNRFAIDPREQLLAQKWSRSNQLKVLGSAHSHPNKNNFPSYIDMAWSTKPNLMVIVDQYDDLNAWWISNDQNIQKIKITISLD